MVEHPAVIHIGGVLLSELCRGSRHANGGSGSYIKHQWGGGPHLGRQDQYTVEWGRNWDRLYGFSWMPVLGLSLRERERESVGEIIREDPG